MKKFLILALAIIAVAPGINVSCKKSPDSGLPADTSLMLNLNGVNQYIEIHGESDRNPVLLFIHGGPAWPATPMIRSRNASLFKDVTMVSWDQRNCGKSESDTLVPLTIGLYVDDAHALTQFLKTKFGVEKIYLAGHSWGSVIGINLIKLFPDDYAGYIGMGQVVNLKMGDSIAREQLIRLASEAGDSATILAEASIPFSVAGGYQNGWDDMIRHRILLVKYRINDHDTLYENRALMEYSDYNSLDWITPVFRDGRKLYPELISVDFTGTTEFEVPVYLMAGRYDYNTSFPVVEAWFKTIKAPKKEFTWFENSGHSPHWEEPDLFAQEVREICKGLLKDKEPRP